MDVSLVIVGNNKAYLQTEQNTIEFNGTSSQSCADFDIADKSKMMIIRAETINNNCYYVLCN